MVRLEIRGHFQGVELCTMLDKEHEVREHEVSTESKEIEVWVTTDR